MIGEEATFEKFGYYSTDWAPKSHKKIIVVCDDCGKIRVVRKDAYHSLCHSCTQKGERHPLFGEHASEETRKKLSDAHKGIYPSEETRKKMSDARKDKHLSEEARKKLRDARKGENNPNWQGGTSYGKYCEKFNYEFKEKIRDKFGRICFLCSKTEEENGKRLSVHHVNHNKACGCDGDKTCQFVPLCMRCHGKVHSKKIDWEGKIKAKMQNKLNGWYI